MQIPTHHIRAFTLIECALLLVGLSLLSLATTVQAAFTLLELSMVLIVIALLGSVALSTLTQDSRREKQAELQRKLDKIENAMRLYAKKQDRLPCPADGTKVKNVDATFGSEATATGDCMGASPANFDNGSDTVGGVVPVRTLAAYGLTDEDLLDPWGTAFGYFVSQQATAVTAFTSHAAQSNFGEIHVTDGGGNARSSTAIALVLSYGPNGHGGFTQSGTRKNAGSTNTDELENCDCDSSAVATTFDYSFTLHPATTDPAAPLNSFDDSGRYYQRNAFLTAADLVIPDAPP